MFLSKSVKESPNILPSADILQISSIRKAIYMTISHATNNDQSLNSTVDHYALALEKIEVLSASKTYPSPEQVLEVLIARDAVAATLDVGVSTNTKTLAFIIQLDEHLKKHQAIIAKAGQLDEWRKSLHPPDTAWWWFFEAPKEIHTWDRWDWLWEALTAAALVLSGSYMLNTMQAFSIGGLGVAETFGTLTQAAGLALVGKGALTTDGKQKVNGGLNKLKIPEHLHSEVMFGFSILILGGAYGVHSAQPKMSELYYQQGQKAYKNGDLNLASDNYLQAMRLEPSNVNINIALGEIYESVGEIDKALAQYKSSLESGSAQGFNHTGRIYIQKKEPMIAETMLRMGLQRADDDLQIQYQLHRNLGWALWQQKRYQEAQKELELAIEIDEQIPKKKDKLSGAGMANCLLADVLEELGNNERGKRQWQYCQKNALPETLNEYKWFMEVGERKLANEIDTSSVVRGLNRRSSANSNQQPALKEQATPAPTPTAKDPQQIEGEASPSY